MNVPHFRSLTVRLIAWVLAACGSILITAALCVLDSMTGELTYTCAGRSIAADVLGAVRTFAGGAPQADHITILAVRYFGGEMFPRGA